MKWFRGVNSHDGRVGPASVPLGGEKATSPIWDALLTEANYFVVDIETTGFSADRDKILSLAAGCLNGMEKGFSNFIYEYVDHRDLQAVPEHIWSITGLSPEQLRTSGRDLTDIVLEALSLSVNRIWIAHHARHELSFLQRYCRHLLKVKLRPIVIDTAVVAQALGNLARVPTLDEVCKWLGIPIQNRHQADGDVQMTAEVWRREMVLCQNVGLTTVAEVIDWVSSRAMGQDW